MIFFDCSFNYWSIPKLRWILYLSVYAVAIMDLYPMPCYYEIWPGLQWSGVLNTVHIYFFNCASTACDLSEIATQRHIATSRGGDMRRSRCASVVHMEQDFRSRRWDLKTYYELLFWMLFVKELRGSPLKDSSVLSFSEIRARSGTKLILKELVTYTVIGGLERNARNQGCVTFLLCCTYQKIIIILD